MKKRHVISVLFFVAIFFLLLISFSLNWIAANFGAVGIDEILFHINMPLKGTGNSYIENYIFKTLLPAAGVTLEIVLGIIIVRELLKIKPKIWEKAKEISVRASKYRVFLGIGIIILWLGAASIRAQKWFGLFDFVQSMIQRTNFYEQEYVNPLDVKLTFPEKKRNLIYIFVESAETSSQNRENGGLLSMNYIPEMTEIAKENISFSQSNLLEGASVAPLCGWTIAGMVAETAGLPLKLYSVHKSRINNSMDQYDTFLPGAVTLGDILDSEGYHNVFMAGSDFEFGGRLNYCTQHGNYDIYDYNRAIKEGVIPEDYYVWWGFEDKILFSWAKDVLTELGDSEQPFNFSILTVDTHAQDGYMCDICEHNYVDNYANVWRCASNQVGKFIDWIQQQDFYENTTVIICGDHCSMDRDFYGDIGYDKYNGESVRKVYNAFLNSAVIPVHQNNRLFTTMDMFPSTLAAMGVHIEGERLGLGVNLFSDEKTLPEQYGYEYMFSEMTKMSIFYDEKLLYPQD